MNEFIEKLDKFLKLQDERYPFGDSSLKNFLKFLKTKYMEIKLFNKNKRGSIQEWTIEVLENAYRTHEGLLGGKITTSEWTYCKGKNIGKSNETTPEQQAEAQARSIADKKIHSGYRETIEELEEGKGWFQPMLAHKWEGQLEDVIIIQPKLDGMRCIITKDGMFSRNGKPIIGAPHIYEELKTVFEMYPDLIFDGELYNHELKNDFNKIISHARKTKPTPEDLEESRKNIQYHCYDCVFENDKDLSFQNRFGKLIGIVYIEGLEFLKLVDTRLLIKENEDPFNPDSYVSNVLDNYYHKWLEEGYEGQMIRLDRPYDNCRSNSLLKRKEFIDEEFEVLDIEEGVGNRSGMMGRILFKTKEDRRFTASSRGNEEYFRDLLINKDNYIGKIATVRYQNMTPDGSPRFPVVITIRDYE